jgi:hypothetical protein
LKYAVGCREDSRIFTGDDGIVVVPTAVAAVVVTMLVDTKYNSKLKKKVKLSL